LPVQSGSYELAIQTTTTGSGLTLQQIVSIPSGTTVDCKFYGRLSTSGPSSWVFGGLTIDGSYCSLGNYTSGSPNWEPAANVPLTLSGNTHQVDMYLYINDNSNDLLVFELDNISITPAGSPSC
jgi:hypothetical protein